ncbi:hypothetical protein ETA_33000 [Erwinia tasmaniensis Et1/99]|uniref:Uncharacterized protein n=1 Tax=Erwinia tasmaniensis (strain DSM 17950 / CFBP 7177 / CIP 109463 / NCPPB 4357 / Et1/99) TaxID=465817 RepID=B2VJL7_ERWT9|nr:hypothetical protein ETA_33000 [Erwinia tasmaniensis Et1/99]
MNIIRPFLLCLIRQIFFVINHSDLHSAWREPHCLPPSTDTIITLVNSFFVVWTVIYKVLMLDMTKPFTSQTALPLPRKISK